MGKQLSTEKKRTYVERLLACDLPVEEWSRRNHVSSSAAYRWLTEFAEREPELFGGAQNIRPTSERRWFETTRNNLRKSRALAKAPGFVMIGQDDLRASQAEPLPGAPKPSRRPEPIRIRVGALDIEVPPGADAADVSVVLRAAMAL